MCKLVAELLGYASAELLIADLLKQGYRLKCKPCDPPKGTYRQRSDDKPNSKPHNGMAKHYHIFIVNQSPVIAGCKCFNSEIKDSPVECNPHFEEVAPCEGGGIEISR